MKIIYVGKKIEIGEKLKEKIAVKFSKIEKIFAENDATAIITLTQHKNRSKADILISSKLADFKGEAVTNDNDVMIAVTDAIDNVVRQIRKYKTKIEKKYKSEKFDFSGFVESIDEEDNFDVIKQKKFTVKPMDVEEAILQMNLLNHEFFVFRNANDENINVVYKRKNGNYGLIETE